jgi:hypothetical protein
MAGVGFQQSVVASSAQAHRSSGAHTGASSDMQRILEGLGTAATAAVVSQWRLDRIGFQGGTLADAKCDLRFLVVSSVQ